MTETRHTLQILKELLLGVLILRQKISIYMCVFKDLPTFSNLTKTMEQNLEFIIHLTSSVQSLESVSIAYKYYLIASIKLLTCSNASTRNPSTSGEIPKMPDKRSSWEKQKNNIETISYHYFQNLVCFQLRLCWVGSFFIFLRLSVKDDVMFLDW